MRLASLTILALLASTSHSHANSQAEQAFAAMMKDLNKSEIVKVTSSKPVYDEASDTLTVNNLTYTLSWKVDFGSSSSEQSAEKSKQSSTEKKTTSAKEKMLKSRLPSFELAMNLTIPKTEMKGLSLEKDGIGYQSIRYMQMKFDGTVRSDEKDANMDFSGSAKGSDIVTNGFQPFMGELSDDKNRPISRYLDFIRPLILKTRYESYVSDGYTFSTKSEDGALVQKDDLGPLKVIGFAKGKLAEMSMDYRKHSSQHSKGDKFNQSVTQDLGLTSYQNIDYGAILSAIDPKMPKLNGTTTILGKATTASSELKAQEAFSVKVGETQQSKTTITQPATYLVPLLDKFIASGKEFKDLSTDEAMAIIRASLDLIDAINLGGGYVQDLNIGFQEMAGPDKGKSGNITAGQITFDQISSRKFGEVAINNFAVNAPDGIQASFNRFAITDLTFPERAAMEDLIKLALEDKDPSTAQLASIGPRKFNLNLTDLAFSDLKQSSVTANSLSVSHRSDGLALPVYLSVKSEDLSLSQNLIKHPLASVLMQKLNLKTLNINHDITLVWDEEKETYSLTPLDIKLGGIARLAGAIGFGGIKRSYLADPESAQAAMATGSILPSKLMLTNEGGLSELINLAGGMAGMGPEQVRSFAGAQAQAMLSAYTKPDFAEVTAGHIRAFLANPQSLQIMLNPASPVPVAQILGVAAAAPKSLPEILTISVKANEGE